MGTVRTAVLVKVAAKLLHGSVITLSLCELRTAKLASCMRGSLLLASKAVKHLTVICHHAEYVEGSTRYLSFPNPLVVRSPLEATSWMYVNDGDSSLSLDK